jgi:tryptophan halogenase
LNDSAGEVELSEDRIRSLVLVGGGVAGWVAAATLARALKPGFCEIRVIDSPQLDSGLTSEASLPSFHRLNGLLGINELDLMRKTRATFRLGTQFLDWGTPGDRYFHTFGSIGARLEAVPFHQYWLRLRQSGGVAGIEEFSIAATAAKCGRFARPTADRRSVLSHYSYGYHFHAGLLAEYLREYAQAHGVVRLTGEVTGVQLRSDDGFIESLKLDDGNVVRGDLYIDCTGARNGVLARALHTEYVDWSHWLPCDRAVTIPCASADGLPPHSQSVACPSGWQWRVPLKQCVDSGLVYSSEFLRDGDAVEVLSKELFGRVLAEPRFLNFAAGRPRRFWSRNCLILAGSAMEPLESTSLHLVQTGVTRLLSLFPVRRFSAEDVEEYNRVTIMEHERIRDFLILHYKANTRQDAPLWDYCRNMEVPDTLRDKVELFRNCGRISLLDEEHFGEDSWLTLFLGQGIVPQSYDPLADVLQVDTVRAALAQVSSTIRAAVQTLPMCRHDG